MQAAASIAASAAFFGTGVRLASGAEPVLTEMKPPASMMASSGLRSTMRSRITGKAVARHGSMVMVSPSVNLRMCSWQVAVPRSGPWAWPLIITPQVPQMPSRQSLSNTIGSLPGLDQLLVDDVEHLEERHVGLDVGGVELVEPAWCVGPVLAPHPQVRFRFTCSSSG